MLWCCRTKPLAVDAVVYVGGQRRRSQPTRPTTLTPPGVVAVAPHGACRAALTLLQRLLHQQIRLRVRLSYDWSALYESVFAMVEAVAATIKATATTADDPLWTAADKVGAKSSAVCASHCKVSLTRPCL